MKVYLLMKHPRHPFDRQDHINAGEVYRVYSDRSEPDRIAAEKNARRPMYLWRVHGKEVK